MYGRKNYCDFVTNSNNVTSGYCVCSYEYAMVDCEYKRYDKNLAGGLQFLAFAGVGGIGNFVIQRTTEGVAQFVMMLSSFLLICLACGVCGVTLVSSDDSSAAKGSGFLTIAQCLFCLASLVGFTWCMIDPVQLLGGELPDGNGYYPYDTPCVFKLGIPQ